MEVDDRACLFTRPQQRVPIIGIHAFKPESLRVFREANRAKTSCGVADYLLCGHRRIAQPWKLTRNESRWIGRAPLIEHPSVVGAQRRQSRADVSDAQKPRPGKSPDDRREAQRRIHTVQVHVGKTRPRVIDAGSEVFESLGRYWLELREWTTRRAVRRDDRNATLIDQPPRGTSIVGDHPR